MFAPMPSANVSTTIAVTPELFASMRSPYRTSCQSVCISASYSYRNAVIGSTRIARLVGR